MTRQHAIATLALLASIAMALPVAAQQAPPGPPSQAQGGQPAPPPQGGPPPRGPGQRGPGQVGREGRPENPSADLQMPPGRWWNDSSIAQNVGLSAEQIKKMDDIFNGARDHLIDLDADVRKAEGGLQPLLDNYPIDRAKIMAQVERFAQAKAALEKANAQMLIDILAQLTHDQWVKLESMRPPQPPGR
jgi:Spy/CpxP family protein refolding chaperone